MATYFHGAPEIQPDGLQTLYLMNPSYVAGYSDSTAAPADQQASMVYLNSPLSSLTSIPQPQQQHHQQHFVGIPLQAPLNKPNQPPPSMQTTSTQYNLWAPAPSTNADPIDIQSQLGARRPGLSLSLSPQQAQFAAASSGGEETRFVGGSSSSNGPAGLQSVLMGSTYLKAAQQLLDEVVSVGRGEAAAAAKANDSPSKITMKSKKDLDGDGDGNGKKAADLSTAERQELQMKKAKLVNMLDEVEQRYRQYHRQMQIVVSSFEMVAGFGSAKTYTALALQTISKQFRCLRDAISGQIKATSKSLGEEDCMAGGGSKSVGSRLRFVDHHLRQQRALQQLGMIHHNAWRPQRGLPERAVSVLRAWLFEHFLHPYPKDSDKHLLAKQTGLTRSQVSNWFINARVRLWKPMVEEMYLEESKEQEQNNSGHDKASKSEASEQSASKSTSQQANSGTPPRAEQTDNNPPMAVPSSDLAMFNSHNDEAIMQQRLKKQRSDVSLHQNMIAASQMSMEMKPDELSNRELLMKFMDQGAGFGAYPIGEIGRFDHEQFAPRFAGNGVSLTLGLPHCETLSLSGSQEANYLSNESMQLGRKLELSSEENNYFSLSNSNANNPSASNAYESINIQNRKRFAAQLLPDFVA